MITLSRSRCVATHDEVATRLTRSAGDRVCGLSKLRSCPGPKEVGTSGVTSSVAADARRVDGDELVVVLDQRAGEFAGTGTQIQHA